MTSCWSGRVLFPMVAIFSAALIAAGQPPQEQKPVEPPAPKLPVASATPKSTKAPQSIEEFKREIGKILAKNHVPGIGIALVNRDSVIWAGGVGKADLASGREITADTMFRIGSITKGFVALSILQLQEQGKISLESKVSEIAPEVPMVNPWENTDPVRVANLLEHTAGFDDFPLAEFYDFNGGNVPLIDTLRRFPEPQHSRWRPGTIASYSNPDYAVAGYLVAKVSGEPCGQYLAEHILRPLKMEHSDMRMTAEVRAALAQGYEWSPPQPVPYYPIYLRPAGELKSSPAEMARFVRMMLNRGELDGVRIVSADSIARMETPKTGFAARNGVQYGYGLGNMATLDHDFIAHGHDGGIDGFLSHYAYLPDAGAGFFYSINDSGPNAGAAFKQIDDLTFAFVTRGITPPPKPKAVPLDSNIARWAGFYEFAAPRQQRTAFITRLLTGGWTYIDHGKLYRRGLIPGAREEMIYLGHNQFRTEKERAAEGVYLTDTDGTMYGCGGVLACFRKTGALWPVTRLGLVALALLLMASSIGFAAIWIPRKVFGRMRAVRHLWVRILPLLAVLAFVAIALEVRRATSIEMARPTLLSLTIMGTTTAFAALSLLSAAAALRSFGYEMNRGARIHSLLVASACLGLTLYMAYFGLIGTRPWTL